MAQGIGKIGPDFDLPDEVLSVIPTDPYDQLDLARKITSMAIASRVSQLEAEVARMVHRLQEKDRVIYELEAKAAYLERAYREATLDLKAVNEENIKLSKERDSLATTAKKLGRDFAKLESFKRQLMQSLTDDAPTQTEATDLETEYQSVPRAYPDKDEQTTGYSVHHFYGSSPDLRCTIPEASGQDGQGLSLTPYIKSSFSTTGTPRIGSTSVSPRAYSALTSPKRTSGSTTPTNTYYGRITMSSHYPSSQQSSVANSPPRARTPPARAPPIDGKEFFRQTRNRLSYEQFSAFLSNVKELNAQKQTREETLRKAEEIFGSDNKDLYLSFRGLLYRNSH